MTFLPEKSSYLMCWFSTYLLHRADRTNRFPPTKCCPVWDLIREKEDLPSQEIGSFISYPSARKQKTRKTWKTANNKSNLLLKRTVTRHFALQLRGLQTLNVYNHTFFLGRGLEDGDGMWSQNEMPGSCTYKVNEVPSTCGILYAFDTANLKAL